MNLQVGVKAILKNKEGKYLLLKRAPSKFKGINGTWDIAGGRINPGTPLIENLKREVREETGLDVISEPKLLFAQDILRPENDLHVVRLTYIAQTEGDPVLDQTENIEYKWLSLEEIKKHQNLDEYLSDVMKSGVLD